jgi:redox-sensitive bicupin YhaK (pirin superfamily)
MTLRSVKLVGPPNRQSNGVLRPFPSASIDQLDPFIFLDTGAPLQLGDDDIYVGPHAHRGVQPISLLFKGRIEHRDSLGSHRTVESGGMQWLFAGDLHGRSGPAPMPTPVLVAHLRLEKGAQVNIPIPRGWSAAYTVVEGSASSGGDVLTSGHTVVFQSDGDAISIASEGGGEVLVMAGAPIGEPVARGYGFVMNTSEEIVEAISDYRSGAMGTLAPSR